jgi:hypothetical protein
MNYQGYSFDPQEYPMATPTRVFWTPKTNSQRTALGRFGTDWELAPGFEPFAVRGRLCRFIRPVGNQFEARWVPVEQIKEKAPATTPHPAIKSITWTVE